MVRSDEVRRFPLHHPFDCIALHASMEQHNIPSLTARMRPTQPSPIVTSTPALKQKTTSSRIHKPSSKRMTDVNKPKQSKSRNGTHPALHPGLEADSIIGCQTCKHKRLKCDETKPSCQQCHKRNVKCGGYNKDYKWRSFEEAAFTAKPTPQKTKKGQFCRLREMSSAKPRGSCSPSQVRSTPARKSLQF